MSQFWASGPAWTTPVILVALFVFGLFLGALWGWGRGAAEEREEARWAREDAADDAREEAIARRYRQRRGRAGSRGGTVMPYRPPELHHEPDMWGAPLTRVWQPDPEPDPLTDSQYTAGMAVRMSAFLEELFAVPYSADELWSGQ